MNLAFWKSLEPPYDEPIEDEDFDLDPDEDYDYRDGWDYMNALDAQYLKLEGQAATYPSFPKS